MEGSVGILECSMASQCYAKTFKCDNELNDKFMTQYNDGTITECHIICSGKQACYQSTFYCPQNNGNHINCRITGYNNTYTAQQAKFYGENASNIYVNASVNYAFDNTRWYFNNYPSNIHGTMDIHLNGNAQYAFYSSYFYYQKGQNIWIHANASYSFRVKFEIQGLFWNHTIVFQIWHKKKKTIQKKNTIKQNKTKQNQK